MDDIINPDFWSQAEEETGARLFDNSVEAKSDAEGVAFTDEVIIEKIT